MVLESTDASIDVDMDDSTGSEPLMLPIEEPSEHMEGVQITEMPAVEGPSSVEDPLEGEYLWEIPDFDTIKETKMNSETFEAGGYYWNLLLFPDGNGSRGNCSVYLAVPDTDIPAGWQRRAKIVFSFMNKDPAKHCVKETEHAFEGRENDWGFTQFMQTSTLRNPNLGFIVDGTVKLHVKINVQHPDSYLYKSKRETGFVGLKNQGATCYMNSLLQTLYNINCFRQAVYHMPTTEDELPSKSIPLALQSLFFKLQFGDNSVSTKNLTQSFGWTTMDAFTQHDVQELNRILSDRLEEKMKGTKVEGVIGRLFEGRIHNFVECINVDYKSTRQEVFADLQLLVKGCKNMYDSFDKYVEVEKLDGQNQYMAEGHGLQDAKKGMLFESFPPILQIQLRRFEYDFVRDAMIKINDRYEFPEELDLDTEDGKYLSDTADRNVRNKYRLHSVLVHSGGIHGGHYYAYINPTLNPTGQQWLKFDDERVTKEDAKQALDEQYGGQDEPGTGYNQSYRYTKHSNAYMLVYMRESDWPQIMCEVTRNDLADHVRERLEKEQHEKLRVRKEKEESHLYTIIRVARDQDLQEQIGNDIFFELVNHDKVSSFRVKKHSKFREFRALIATEWGIPPENQFWWTWLKRNNETYRPLNLLSEAHDNVKVSEIREQSPIAARPWPPRLNLILQVPTDEETYKVLTGPSQKSHCWVFLKQFLPRQQQLKYAGHIVVPLRSTFKDLLPILRRKGGFSAETTLLLWEEVRYHPDVMVNSIDLDRTFEVEQIGNGDILVFHEQLTLEETKMVSHPTAQAFLVYMKNKVVVTFKRHEDPKEAGFELELSQPMTYDQVEAAVAKKLALEDSRLLRFTQHTSLSGMPKPHPFSYRGAENLAEMLGSYASIPSSIIYYEVLDLPLPQLEKLKTLKVSWHNSRGEQTNEHKLRVANTGTVQNLLEALREVEPEAVKAKDLRLMEILNNNIYKIYESTSDEPVDGLKDNYWYMRAEAVPEDEIDVPEGARVIYVCHVLVNEGKHVTTFGDPFTLRLEAEETMAEVGERIRGRLGVASEEFAKWKFCQVNGVLSSSVGWLEPGDVVGPLFARHSGIYNSSGQPYLGLHHSVTHSKRSQPRSSSVYDRAIKINS